MSLCNPIKVEESKLDFSELCNLLLCNFGNSFGLIRIPEYNNLIPLQEMFSRATFIVRGIFHVLMLAFLNLKY